MSLKAIETRLSLKKINLTIFLLNNMITKINTRKIKNESHAEIFI
jgi:hypothetical protein